MGLQVWLPLNGNIDNQGLSNYQATNTNAIINTNGKIGKCYQFGPGQSYLELPKECMRNLSTECTVSFWIKIITRNSYYETYFQAGLGGIAWNNYVFGLLRNYNGNSCCFTISNGSSASNANYTTPDLTELNTWYHITLVYKTGHCLVYMNGELYQDYTTTIIPAFDKITTITIGCGNTKTSYQTNCLMNDFRIYDTALSSREIKEISKGLVLHYPLNRGGFGQDNLVNGLYAAGRTIVNNGIVTALLSQNLDCYFRFTCSEDLLAENDYTISMDVSGFSGSDKYLVWGIISQNSGQNITMRNGKCFAIFSPSSNITAGTKIIIDDINRTSSGLTDLTIRNIKVEHGSIPTPWTPAPSDALYSQMGLDNNIEYDVSGYGNNATKTGDITYTSNTPRYNVSTSINTNGSCLVVSGLTTTGFSNSFSIAWWGNVSDFSNKMMWGFRDGIRLNGIYNGNLWNTGDGSDNPIYQPGTTTKVTAPSVGVWHHYVMTGDGTNNYLYVDGVLYGESKTYKGISGTTIYFNGWTDSSDYRYADGLKLSDFRIYATALSADDVMALYHTPISLANNGTLLTQGEYVES